MKDRSRPEAFVPLPPHLFEILLSLAAGPRHGYSVIADVRERSGGRLELSTSTLYGSIHRLVGNCLVIADPDAAATASAGPPRQYYRITKLGLDVVRLEARRLERAARSARDVLDAVGRAGQGR